MICMHTVCVCVSLCANIVRCVPVCVLTERHVEPDAGTQ